MNRQDIFNRVAGHLLTQKVAAKDANENCIYLDEATGNRCAIGCLIPDGHEALNSLSDMEGLLEEYPDLVELWQVDIDDQGEENDIDFFNGLQFIHDFSTPKGWKTRLTHFADDHELNKNVLENF